MKRRINTSIVIAILLAVVSLSLIDKLFAQQKAKPQEPLVITAREFRVVNEKGKLVVSMGSKWGGGTVILYDEKTGDPRIMMGTNGGMSSVGFLAKDKSSVLLSISHFNSGVLRFSDKHDDPQMTMGFTPGSDSGIAMGKFLLTIEGKEKEQSLVIKKRDGSVLWRVPQKDKLP